MTVRVRVTQTSGGIISFDTLDQAQAFVSGAGDLDAVVWEFIQDERHFDVSNWDGHPLHPVSDWQAEVEADDTRLGYWPWVESRIVAASS